MNQNSTKTPSQDAQGPWYPLRPSTQVLTESKQNMNDKSQDQTKKEEEKTMTTKKKKCRGNRKAQRLRRRERRRHQQQKSNDNNTNHMDHDAIIIEDDNDRLNEVEELQQQQQQQQNQIRNNSLQNQHEIRLENKCKRQDSNKDDININRSFSQLSICQEHRKKKMVTTTGTNPSNNQITQGMDGNDHQERDTSLPMNSMQAVKPSYLKVPGKIFKEMLSKTVENSDQMMKSLDTVEKLQLVRQITEATNQVYYLDLQRHLWQDYYNIGIREEGGNQWAPKLSKSFAKQHHTCRTYGMPKHIVEQRQQNIVRQSQYAAINLQEYLIKLQQNSLQWQSSIDPTVLSNIINEFVTKSQQRLKEEFDYRRNMLELNFNDHALIGKFYDLQPNQEQIHLAKMIWQATANKLKVKEFIEIARKRIALQRLPSGIDKIINRSVESIEILNSDPVIDRDDRASLNSVCSKTVTQYKFDCMSMTLNAMEGKKRGYQRFLVKLQDKLSQSNCNMILKEAIEDRQEAMQQRHDIYLKHKLQSFFDEAPTTETTE